MGKARQQRRAKARAQKAPVPSISAQEFGVRTAREAIISDKYPKRGRNSKMDDYKGVSSSREVFEEYPGLDFDERAAGERHARVVQGEMNRSHNAPADKWVDVPKGMVPAPDTFVDTAGVLRHQSNNSCVVWHNGGGGCGPTGQRGTYKTGIMPFEIIYDPATGAPWCPICFAKNSQVKVFGQTHSRDRQEVERAASKGALRRNPLIRSTGV